VAQTLLVVSVLPAVPVVRAVLQLPEVLQVKVLESFKTPPTQLET
jgi:hypothetical protein